jgi:c-di-GMP-binding flagellar brake protein YcgR
MSQNKGGIERRRVKRRDIMDQFSFYICIPKLGFTRHQVSDISELGIGIRVETLGEFRLHQNETCDLQFYLNQSLYLSLKIQVVRSVDHPEAIQEVGAIFLETETKAHQTFLTLVNLVDQLSETAQVRI